MNEARLSVSLPEYETELAANQRAALRTAALLAAPILVAFTLLDRFTAPAAWLRCFSPWSRCSSTCEPGTGCLCSRPLRIW